MIVVVFEDHSTATFNDRAALRKYLETPTVPREGGALAAQASQASPARAQAEQKYSPPLSPEELAFADRNIKPGRVYKKQHLIAALGDEGKARRLAYWLQREGFWFFNKKGWRYERTGPGK